MGCLAMAKEGIPGVMLYFDVRKCLKRFSIEDKGMLFEAILDYAELGVLPDFDGALGVAWDFIQPKIDRDREAYEKRSERGAKAAKSRWSKDNDGEGMQNDANNANAYGSTDKQVTTTIPSTTSTNISSKTAVSAQHSKDAVPQKSFDELKREGINKLEAYAKNRART